MENIYLATYEGKGTLRLTSLNRDRWLLNKCQVRATLPHTEIEFLVSLQMGERDNGRLVPEEHSMPPCLCLLSSVCERRNSVEDKSPCLKKKGGSLHCNTAQQVNKGRIDQLECNCLPSSSAGIYRSKSGSRCSDISMGRCSKGKHYSWGFS